VRVPNGFAITADAYRHFMYATGAATTVEQLTKGRQRGNLAELAERGLAIRQAILAASLPDDLQQAVAAAYQRLGDGHRSMWPSAAAPRRRIIMVPFCRTPEEARRVVDELGRNGLQRGDTGLELYMNPEFARFLVECGIDSMSLNPDAVLRTTRHVLEVEATRVAGGPDKVSPAAPVETGVATGGR
jgi:phosphoenolpyruvate synthase/pyruvate phosphate dikinase